MPKTFISCLFLQINVNYITYLQIKYVCIDFMFTEQRPTSELQTLEGQVQEYNEEQNN